MNSVTTSPGDLNFVHRFIPAQEAPDVPTLLLLHGTGGNEHDLLELGRSLAPGYHLLSPRGKVLENGMPRFFRRLAEGVFDEKDLIFRTEELAAFVRKAVQHYGLDAGKITALGYSNGANIAASLLLLQPDVLSRAVLLRGMSPFELETLPDLTGRKVLLAAGEYDPMIPADRAKVLVDQLQRAGAAVTEHWSPTGHQLTSDDLAVAAQWINTSSS